MIYSLATHFNFFKMIKIPQILLLAFLFCAIKTACGQDSLNKYNVTGTIIDALTNEPLIGATVIYAPGKGTQTDVDGNYKMKLPNGNYDISINYMGYNTQKFKIKVLNKDVSTNLKLESLVLDEIEVVANVAQVRETPVAFTNITQQQIKEELGSRDIAMLMNSTPGAYATEQGGGSGDARVTIRGFSQNNVAVLVDGVPVNDMETGAVFWSNWDGLGEITRSIQVQRGLGASKLAIPSVGGTMNILTQGINEKFSVTIKQEVGNNNALRSSVGINSGLIKNKFGVTAAFSYKQGDGYVDQTWTKAYSYFIKLQWKVNSRHLISLGANGAPQSHGQRTSRYEVPLYDREYAQKIGIDVDSVTKFGTINTVTTNQIGDRGLQFNPDYGYINGKAVGRSVNYYHKPLFSLNHFWNVSAKLNVSTVAYTSLGSGGGTQLSNTSANRDNQTGLYNFQQIYDNNTNPVKSINPYYSDTELKASNFIQAQENNHQWYGLLSTATIKATTKLTLTPGIDARYYHGYHITKVYDLMGADYTINTSNANMPGASDGKEYIQNDVKHKGDVILRNYDGLVKWGGLFLQAEYKFKKWTTFFTATFSETGYQRKDYFTANYLDIDGKKYYPTWNYGDSTKINGTKYYYNTSPESKKAFTKEKWFLGYTVKGGANYNLTDHHSVFANIGYLSMAPRFTNIFDNKSKEYLDAKNQKIFGIELGYGAKYRLFAANINTYYTTWENKPPTFAPVINTADGPRSINVNGVQAIHKGIEGDFIFKFLRKFELEGLMSIGDWRNNTDKTVYLQDEAGNNTDSVHIQAKNIFVGDAAQIQYGASLRFMPIKGLYIKPRFTYFAKNYANYDYISLTGSNANRQSWKLPNYGLLDLYLGYEFKISKIKFTVNGSITNILNVTYITDATNNGSTYFKNFDANSATVYMGMGTRFNSGLRITF